MLGEEGQGFALMTILAGSGTPGVGDPPSARRAPRRCDWTIPPTTPFSAKPRQEHSPPEYSRTAQARSRESKTEA